MAIKQSYTNESISIYCKAIELNPNSFELHQKLGEAFHLLGNLTAALASYRRALELAPDEASIHYKLWEILVGDTFALPDKWGKAAQFYRQLLEANRNSSWTYHYLAATLSISEQWEEAAAAAQEAIALNGGYLWSHLILSHALTSRKQWSELVACYCKTLTFFPDSAEIHSNLWEAFCQLQNWEEATNRYRQLLEQTPNSCWSYYYLGRTLTQLRKWEEALASYRYALELVPEEASIHYKLWETLVGDTFDLPDKWDKAAQHYRQLLQSHPHSFWICHYLAAILCQNQQWEAAAAAAQQAIALNGGYLWTHLILSHALTSRKQWSEVVACYGKTLTFFPDSAEIHSNLWEAFCQLQNWEEATSRYRQLLEQNPNSCWSYYYLGRTLTQLRKWEEALASYRYALELVPEEASIHHKFWETLGGDFFALPDKWNKATQLYHQLLQSHPNSFWICHYLAAILCQSQQWEAAAAAAQQAVALNGEYLWTHLILSHALTSRKQWSEVVACYSKTLTFFPDSAEIHSYLWEAFGQWQNWEEATNRYRQLLEQNPNSYWTRCYLGRALTQLRKWDEALAYYHQALEFAPLPDAVEVHSNLWEAFDQWQNWEEATNWYRQFLKQNPNSYWTHCYLGRALAQLRKWEDAIASYCRALELAPDETKIHWQLWLTLFEVHCTQNWKQAADCYYQILKLHPNSLQTHYYLGAIHAHLQEWDEAIASYRQTGEFNSNSLYFSLSFAQHRLQLWEEAIASYRCALAKTPGSFEAEQCLSVALQKLPTWEGFLEWYCYILKFGPYSTSTHQQLEVIIVSTKQWSAAQLADCLEAISACRIALESKTTLSVSSSQGLEALHLQAFQVKAEAWVSQNFKKASVLKEVAISLCQQQELPDPDLEYYINMGGAAYWQGNYSQMMLSFQNFVEVQRNLAHSRQLDKLGIRFLRDVWIFAIGHIACLDYYVKMCILGWLPQGNCPILLISESQIANPCYLNHWRHYLPVISEPSEIDILSPLANYLEDNLCVTAFADGKALECVRAAAFVQKEWETLGYPSLLKQEVANSEAGWQCLQELGIPRGAWFVGLHVRDAHNASIRNANIETYYLAIESIVARGGWVIRMGNPTMEPLPPMPQVIDYAHSQHRSDWMDVFLWAECRFFIGTISGPAQVPPTFGVPCVLTNWMLGYRPWSGKDIFIPKLYWLPSENRYLTFAEAIASTAAYREHLDSVASMGLMVVDNTAEEINELVGEMLERLDGTAEYTKDDYLLQKRFNCLATTHQYIDSNCQAGRAFLRKYVDLLPDINK